MKKGSIFVLCLLLICCTVVMASCSEKNVKPTSISITSADGVSEIKMGETLQLTAKVNPDGVSQAVVWSSGNESIATVSDNGLVTAIADGNVVITATSAVDSSVSKNFPLVVTYQSIGPVVDTTPTSVRLSTRGNVTDVLVGNVLQIDVEVYPSSASQEVVYSSSDDAVATVSNDGLVTGVSVGTAVIWVACKDEASVSSTITINVVEGQQSYETMPYCTHAEYMSAAKDTPIKVKGVVTYILPASDGKASYYVQNGEDGYFIYQQDIVNYPVELGATYAVGGLKYYKNGVNELKDVEYCVRLDESLTATTVDLAGKNVSVKADMDVYHGSRVFASATIKKLATDYTKAFSITITVDGNDTTIYVNPSNMSAEDFAAAVEKFQGAAEGSAIEVYGVMSAFGYGSAKPQILLYSADELTIMGATAAQKVELAKENLSVNGYVNAAVSSIDLPTTSPIFDDVTISWASDNASVLSASGEVNHPAQDTTVTLTATISHVSEAVSATVTFTVFVQGTEFNGTPTVTLTFDESVITDLGVGSYGCSKFKGSYFYKDEDNNQTYEANTFEIGGHNWLLWNTLVAKDASDHISGEYGARTQANADPAKTGRIQLMDAGDYDYIQFDAAVYGSNALGICLTIEYQLEGSDEWIVAYTTSIDSYELTTYRFVLPEGVKTVAIVVVPNSGQRVNIDTITLGTIGD